MLRHQLHGVPVDMAQWCRWGIRKWRDLRCP